MASAEKRRPGEDVPRSAASRQRKGMVVLSLRLSRDELARLEQVAEASGKTVPEVAHAAVTGRALEHFERLSAASLLESEVEDATRHGSEDDWGTAFPTQTALSTAKRFVHHLVEATPQSMLPKLTPYEVAPLPDEGIDLAWKADGQRIDIIFGPEGEIAYLVEDGRGGPPAFKEQHGITVDEAVRTFVELLS